MAKNIHINQRSIGPDQPPYVIAEMSGNHNGDIKRAFKLLETAHAAGAEAVKLQTYTADTITIDHNGPGFVIEGGLWHGRSLYELYQEAHTPWDWHKPLFEKAQQLGITAFSSPFDETAVDLLEDLNAPAYKIASFEAIDIPLIRYVASTGKPMIISTGIANQVEIAEAVSAARQAGCRDLILLHCVSGYPTPAEDINLRTISDIAQRYDVHAGLSDHSMGTAVSVAAIAQGACLIEKHFTLARADGGPDSAFSLEADELQSLCLDVNTAWKSLGKVSYERKPSESGNAQFRRSLYAVRDIAAGEALSKDNIRSIRPGFGLAPKELPRVLGTSAKVAIARGTPLSDELLNTE